ncbi:hypothetical protein OAN307_c03710 [Octadecabacter antarcticus 307]|uniref:Phage integrase central domain-containing protein n=1 Tax=Octadecabacter antarcticus 307 TaxID=391626 RepID=M9R2Y7_9RHOB|nr:hypothetical protein OAN307_c03710 [Octadecabacter antarcticus 307]
MVIGVTPPPVECCLKLVNCDFGRKPVIEITAPMIFNALRKVETKGHYETAHRLSARIGSVRSYQMNKTN